MTPEQEEQVRRALRAVARHEPVSMPPDVAARLDAALAQLTDDGVAAEGARPRAAAATGHRDGRRWRTVLVTAAALAVLALGGGTVALHELGGSSGASTHSEAGAAPSTHVTGPHAAAGNHPPAPADVPRLSTATLGRDVQRVLDTEASGSPGRPAARVGGETVQSPLAAPSGTPPAGSSPPSARAAVPGCATPPAVPGERLLAVRLDRTPAWLAVPVSAGTGLARVYACGSAGTLLATATVRVP